MTYLPQVRFQTGWGVDWVTSVCSVALPEGSVDAVEQELASHGVETRRWWGLGCQTNPAFADCLRGDLGNTDRLGRSVLGLPFAVDMDERQVSRVSAALATALAGL
jgi:dTDP-4-amino-4,6-dideoxygalactose transaminase